MKDSGSIPGLGRSPGEGNGNPLQYSCLKNPRIEEFGRLQPMGSQRVRHNWATEHAHMVYCASAWKPTSDFAFISMPGELRKYRDLRKRILSLLLRSQCHNCFLFKTQQSFPGTHSRLWSPKCNSSLVSAPTLDAVLPKHPFFLILGTLSHVTESCFLLRALPRLWEISALTCAVPSREPEESLAGLWCANLILTPSCMSPLSQSCISQSSNMFIMLAGWNSEWGWEIHREWKKMAEDRRMMKWEGKKKGIGERKRGRDTVHISISGQQMRKLSPSSKDH